MTRSSLREREPALFEPSMLVSVKEAAHLLGLGLTSLYALIASGEIKSIRILDRNLIQRSTIEAYIASRPAVKVKSPRKPRHRRLGR